MQGKYLQVELGQYSSKGRKAVNQDFYGALTPQGHNLNNKGIAIAIADGISSSKVSQIASATAVNSFLSDYYSTPESWSVKRSAQCVLQACNSWLYAQTQNSPYRFDKNKGYICTFSALVFKSNTAHLFHCGDTRIYRLSGGSLEALTLDHRRIVDEHTSYLSRALGIENRLELDHSTYGLEQGDVFILASDGVYEFIDHQAFAKELQSEHKDLDKLAQTWVQKAYDAGSDDNLTLQIAKVVQLPQAQLEELKQQMNCQQLSVPSNLQARQKLDGYEIIRPLSITSRSHVFLALDPKNKQHFVLKTASGEQANQQDYLDTMLMEEWIAKRLNHPNVLKAYEIKAPRKHLFTAYEYIEGQSLKQWMTDNPKPNLQQVRKLIEQIAKGLQAFHRLEMIHQDLRPQNIMIDANGKALILDFGATQVAGFIESGLQAQGIKGTAQYLAPEYFTGEIVDHRADIFSLGVIAYQLLSGQLPYGNAVFKVRDKRNLKAMKYRSLVTTQTHIPMWLDQAIAKACHLDVHKRYKELSEFVYDLHQPNKQYLKQSKPPLIERDPVRFWQGLSMLLLGVIIYLLFH